MTTETLTATVKAPRYRHVLPFLQDMATHLGLEFSVLWHDRGWWRETIHFQLVGEREKLDRAKVFLQLVEGA